MGNPKDFEEMKVWQESRRLVREIYRITFRRPFSRDFGLQDQIRRAGISVMSNIAEGSESATPRLFANFLRRAKGSVGEVRSQLYVAFDQDYISWAEFEATRTLTLSVARQIGGLINYLHNKP